MSTLTTLTGAGATLRVVIYPLGLVCFQPLIPLQQVIQVESVCPRPLVLLPVFADPDSRGSSTPHHSWMFLGRLQLVQLTRMTTDDSVYNVLCTPFVSYLGSSGLSVIAIACIHIHCHVG